jgi:iron-sulfur cluster assembly protein
MELKDHNHIILTDAAKEQIKIHLAKSANPNYYLRLGVRGGGCEGFKYVIQFDSESFEKDYLLEIDGIKLIIDPKSLLYLKGTTLDWQKSLMGKGFKFINPHEQSKCGCGHSVYLKKDEA